MTEISQPMAAPKARCAKCGYRLACDSTAPCTECGSNETPLKRLERNVAWMQIKRTVVFASLGWMVMPVGLLSGLLSIRVNSMGLFFFGLLMLLFVAPPTAVAWSFITATRCTGVVLEVNWSMRDGDVGPWSRWSVRARVFAALVVLQLLGAAMIWGLILALYPGYPAGWP